MRKLLRANLSRLMRNKVFWLMAAAAAAFGVLQCIGRYQAMVQYGSIESISEVFFLFYAVAGVAIALIASLFIGVEYSDGTIRNKLISGCSRSSVYLANFVTCVIAGVAINLMYALLVCATGFPLIGDFGMPVKGALLLFAVGILLVVAYSALFTLVPMLLTNRTISSVLCLLLAVGMLIVAFDWQARLDEPEFYSPITITTYDDGQVETVENQEELPNPRYLSDEQRALVQAALDILPSGQGVQLSLHTYINPPRMMIASAGSTLLCSAIGVILFRRKDLK